MKNLRIKKLQKRLIDSRVNAFLVTKIQNIRYLSGFTGSTAVMLVLKDKAIFVTDFRYGEKSKKQTTGVSGIRGK